jgi:hypothetical protein
VFSVKKTIYHCGLFILLMLHPALSAAQDTQLRQVLDSIQNPDFTQSEQQQQMLRRAGPAPAPVATSPTPPVATQETENPDDEALEDFIEKPQEYQGVRLQGLDKLTAQRERFTATMGAVTQFGNLEIVPRACWKSPPSQRPETAALLEVWEWKPGEQPMKLFFGWMFASSPGLSSLEHPVYDITVLECIEKQHANDAESTGGSD